MAPLTTTSASPRRIVSIASPMLAVPVEQDETGAMLGPVAPSMMAMCPEAESASMFARKNGLTRRGPRSSRIFCCSRMVPTPPMPDAKMTPARRPSLSSRRRPASCTLWSAATTPIWTLRSMRRSSLAEMRSSGWNSLTSPAICTSKGEGSNSVIRSMPERP